MYKRAPKHHLSEWQSRTTQIALERSCELDLKHKRDVGWSFEKCNWGQNKPIGLIHLRQKEKKNLEKKFHRPKISRTGMHKCIQKMYRNQLLDCHYQPLSLDCNPCIICSTFCFYIKILILPYKQSQFSIGDIKFFLCVNGITNLIFSCDQSLINTPTTMFIPCFSILYSIHCQIWVYYLSSQILMLPVSCLSLMEFIELSYLYQQEDNNPCKYSKGWCHFHFLNGR